jgi:hypothetical protein
LIHRILTCRNYSPRNSAKVGPLCVFQRNNPCEIEGDYVFKLNFRTELSMFFTPDVLYAGTLLVHRPRVRLVALLQLD